MEPRFPVLLVGNDDVSVFDCDDALRFVVGFVTDAA